MAVGSRELDGHRATVPRRGNRQEAEEPASKPHPAQPDRGERAAEPLSREQSGPNEDRKMKFSQPQTGLAAIPG